MQWQFAVENQTVQGVVQSVSSFDPLPLNPPHHIYIYIHILQNIQPYSNNLILPHALRLHVKLEPVPLVAELPDGIVVGRPAHVVALLVGVAAANVAARRAAVDGGGVTATVGSEGEVGAIAPGGGAHKVEGTGDAGVAIDEEDA